MRRAISNHHRIAGRMSEITLRLAEPADAPALEVLAALDERPLPPPPHLLAYQASTCMR
jgi:hypothetical protein